ncbi:MAG: beta-ketoacyl synthase chain length factor [Planctomycetes bacterium]|nr:beta-ketoacyl synthase chain length factor [Planctomycetota bacterium]
MNGSPEVAILGVGLWLPGFPTAAAWAAGAADAAVEKPVGAALDRVNRRRASPLDRALADTVAAAVAQAGVDAATVPVVIGSSIGEAATMIGLLDELWRHGNPMSPADFTMSVHNAASGLISISTRNRGTTTSLAADHDTPAAALLEGIGLVQTRGVPVVVACGDEPAPAMLVQHAPPWSMLTAAVVLAPLTATPHLARVAVATTGTATLGFDRFPPLAIENPQIGLAALVDAVLRRTAGVVPLDNGKGRGHRAVVAPGPAA